MAYVTVEVDVPGARIRIGKSFEADSVAGAMIQAVDWAVNGAGKHYDFSGMHISAVHPGGSDSVRTAATNKFRIEVSNRRWHSDASAAEALKGFSPGQTPPPRYPVTINDLMMWRRQNAVVATHFQLWQSGSFPTFEQMLVSLACHLAHELAEFQSKVLQTEQIQAPDLVRFALSEGMWKCTGCGETSVAVQDLFHKCRCKQVRDALSKPSKESP